MNREKFTAAVTEVISKFEPGNEITVRSVELRSLAADIDQARNGLFDMADTMRVRFEEFAQQVSEGRSPGMNPMHSCSALGVVEYQVRFDALCNALRRMLVVAYGTDAPRVLGAALNPAPVQS